MTEPNPQSVASTAGEGVKPAEDLPKAPEGEGAAPDAGIEPQAPETKTPEQEAEEARERQAEKTRKRINSEVGRRKQAEAAARKAEIEAAELRGKLSVQPAETAPPKPGARDTYETDDEWLAAHRAFDRHETRQEAQAQQAEASRRAEEAARQNKQDQQKRTLGEQFGEREAEARAKYDDYDDVIDNSPAQWNDSMREAAMRLPNGPDVVYHISQNPDEADRIALLDPVSAATEMGAIGAKLATAKPKPKTTSAPDPVEPVGGGGDTAVLDPDKMTHEQYRESRGYAAKLKR